MIEVTACACKCGKEPKIVKMVCLFDSYKPETYLVQCKSCRRKTRDDCKTPNEAKAEWNRRWGKPAEKETSK